MSILRAKPYQEWLERIRLEAKSLNEWEEKFLDSIEQRLEEGRPITVDQAKKLEEIYAEKTK